MEIRKILLCVDGEEQTDKAEDFAIAIAKSARASIWAVHVVNPVLKKFADELYTVGRAEYRDYIDKVMREEGDRALEKFERKAQNQGVEVVLKMRHGNPQDEILEEIGEEDYDLVIMGSKSPSDWRARLGLNNLPETVFKKAKKPIVFVR